MPVVDTTRTFTNNEQITSTKLNEIMDNSSFVSGAVVLSGGLEVTAGGQMQIATSGVITAKIADSNITSAKIADSAVTTSKLSTGKPVWSDWTAASPYESTLTLASGRTSGNTGDTSLLFRSGDPAINTSFDASIKRESGANGDLIINNVVNDTATATNGQIHLQINGSTKVSLENDGKITYASAPIPIPSGSAPIYGIRAWVNFDATSDASISGNYTRTSSTTVSIDTGSNHNLIAGNIIYLDFTALSGTAPFDGVYEVDSVVDSNTFTIISSASVSSSGSVTLKRKTILGSGNISNVSASRFSPTIPPTSSQASATGFYIVNMSVEMPNGNYAILGSCQDTFAASDIILGSPYQGSKTSKCCSISSVDSGNTAIDSPSTSVAFLG
jgi:hypothetical protein